METYMASASPSACQRELLVIACGRTCSVDSEAGYAISTFQQALRKTLAMNGQSNGQNFNIFSITGTPLVTDGNLQDAIRNGDTPLLATLTESGNEAIAHMQWKLMQDQMAAVLERVSTCSRQVSQLQQQKQEISVATPTLLQNSLLQNQEVMQSKLVELEEQNSKLIQLFNDEQCKRDLSLQQIHEDIQDLHAKCNQEVLFREQSCADQDAKFAAFQKDNERQKKALDKEMHNLREHLETIFKQHVQIIVDKVAILQESADNAQSVEQLARQSSNARVAELEGRCSSLENRLMESINIHSTKVERLVCQEKATHDRVSHLESVLENTDKEKESNGKPLTREEQLRLLTQGLSNEQAKQLADIEQKFSERQDQEAALREGQDGSAGFHPHVVSALVDEIIGELDKASAAWLAETESTEPLAANNLDLSLAMKARVQSKTTSETSTQGVSLTETSPASSATIASPVRLVIPASNSPAGSIQTSGSTTTRGPKPTENSVWQQLQQNMVRCRSSSSPVEMPRSAEKIFVGNGSDSGSGSHSVQQPHSITHLEGKILPQAPPQVRSASPPVRVVTPNVPRSPPGVTYMSPRNSLPLSCRSDRPETPRSQRATIGSFTRAPSLASSSGNRTPAHPGKPRTPYPPGNITASQVTSQAANLRRPKLQ